MTMNISISKTVSFCLLGFCILLAGGCGSGGPRFADLKPLLSEGITNASHEPLEVASLNLQECDYILLVFAANSGLEEARALEALQELYSTQPGARFEVLQTYPKIFRDPNGYARMCDQLLQMNATWPVMPTFHVIRALSEKYEVQESTVFLLLDPKLKIVSDSRESSLLQVVDILSRAG